jgi:hypothetical protein
MTQPDPQPTEELAEAAHVADAGEPQRLERTGAQADQPPPSPADLDRREARFTRPRKPMGPEPDDIPPTEPREG